VLQRVSTVALASVLVGAALAGCSSSSGAESSARPVSLPAGVKNACESVAADLELTKPIKPLPGQPVSKNPTDAIAVETSGKYGGLLPPGAALPPASPWYPAGGSAEVINYAHVTKGIVDYTMGVAQPASGGWIAVVAAPCALPSPSASPAITAFPSYSTSPSPLVSAGLG
jgi:hypothetical protein